MQRFTKQKLDESTWTLSTFITVKLCELLRGFFRKKERREEPVDDKEEELADYPMRA